MESGAPALRPVKTRPSTGIQQGSAKAVQAVPSAAKDLVQATFGGLSVKTTQAGVDAIQIRHPTGSTDPATGEAAAGQLDQTSHSPTTSPKESVQTACFQHLLAVALPALKPTQKQSTLDLKTLHETIRVALDTLQGVWNIVSGNAAAEPYSLAQIQTHLKALYNSIPYQNSEGAISSEHIQPFQEAKTYFKGMRLTYSNLFLPLSLPGRMFKLQNAKGDSSSKGTPQQKLDPSIIFWLDKQVENAGDLFTKIATSLELTQDFLQQGNPLQNNNLESFFNIKLQQVKEIKSDDMSRAPLHKALLLLAMYKVLQPQKNTKRPTLISRDH